MNSTRTRATLRIDGELTIYRAAELKQALIAPLDAGKDLEVDLSAVTEVDTAGLQLLMLAKQNAARRGVELHLVGHSQAVTEVFELLNLAAQFGDPIVIAPSGAAA